MKQARITERKPTTSGNRFWYELEPVDAPTAGGKPLQRASARGLEGNPRFVDLDEQHEALASLNAWAQENGWTVVA